MLAFRPCPRDEEPAAALVQGMRDEIAALYDGLDLDGPDMPKAGPGELAAPGGTFVVGFEDDVAVCCGGFKRLPDGFHAARGFDYKLRRRTAKSDQSYFIAPLRRSFQKADHGAFHGSHAVTRGM